AVSDLPYQVMNLPAEDEEVTEDYAPAVVAESTQSVGTSSVAEAVMQLELIDEPVHIFRNAGSGAVNVVYRRADGNVGWIDPATVSGATA
ncbi:MAG: sigma 54 modulation/S30EA ribosomal C-terminal domain-containing protein, partial [Pseudomonadota bacterium]